MEKIKAIVNFTSPKIEANVSFVKPNIEAKIIQSDKGKINATINVEPQVYNATIDFTTPKINAQIIPSVSGRSAYRMAVDKGFEGTEEDWLASLKGPKGETGTSFKIIGKVDLIDELPINAEIGDAYFVGLEQPYNVYIWDSLIEQFINIGKIEGPTGPTGLQGEKGEQGDPFTYDDFSIEQLELLKGEKGEKGDKGDPFIYSDFTSEQLELLKGPKGETGDVGPQGLQGIQGLQGDKGDPGTTNYNELENKPDLSSLHTHTNKTTLDGIANTDIANWNAKVDITDLHSHGNKTVLDKFSEDVNGNLTYESVPLIEWEEM